MSAPAIAQGPTPSPTPASASTPPDTSPELKAAWDKAATSGKPVEVPSRFTETMKVWANPDGKNMRAELYTRPVQLKNPASGAWEPVDTRIVTRDGKLQAARVKTPLTFGARGAKQLVSADGEKGKTGLKVTRTLPEPKVSGSTVTYPDAVAPGTDLVVRAQADGFISQVVFRQRPTGPVTVRLPLTLPEGTTFGKTPDGRPQLKNAKGKAAAAPIVLTAMDAKVETSPEEGKSSPVDARVQISGSTSELVFTPDEKFLADPAVTYPVTIAAADDWFGGGEPTDAWVSKNNPGSNNAAAGWLRAGTTQTSADVARVYLKFDTDDPVLEGATVLDADLWVWNYKSGGPNGQLCGDPMSGSGIGAALITSTWETSTLNWSRQPTLAGVAGESGNKAGYNYEADPASWCAKEEKLVHRVTGMARGWIEQGVDNHGMVLRAVTESPAINWRQYYASEHNGDPYPGYRHPPTLMIQYTPAPATYVVVPRSYDGPTPPEPDWESDKAYMDAGNVYHDELPPARALTPEEAMAEAKAEGRSAKTRFLDAYYPDDLTDQELVDGMVFEEDPPPDEVPPDPNPLPEEDTTPPVVSGTTPPDGQTGVPIGGAIKAVFDEPVTDAQITVKDAQGADVAGSTAMNATDTTLTFTPGAALTPATVYTAEVSGAKDYPGNAMAGTHSWSFTTGGPDAEAPAVTVTDPGRDATGVPTSTAVKVTFSETVSAAQVTLKNPSGEDVQGTLAGGDAVWTFTPASPLAAQTVYRAEVMGARDTSGNTMTPYTWSFTTAADTPQPTPGLVAAYGMNEGSGTSVADSSGQNNTGAATAASWQNGKYGKALSFNGSSSWVTVQDAASLRLTTGMTLSAWVNPASVANWSSVVGKELSDDGGVSYLLYAANGGSVPSGWVQPEPSASVSVAGTSPLPVNAWSHLAVTYDGTYLRLFVNGQQVAETEFGESLHDDGSPLRIGGNDPWKEYFRGLIDEVRVYNRAQSAAEIQTDMNTPVGRPQPPDTQAPTAPGSLTATGGPRSASLTWTAATDNVGVTGYTIHRSTTPGFTPSDANRVGSVQSTSFLDAGLAAGTYYYQVRAVDAAGNTGPASAEASATATEPPVNQGLVAAYGMDEGSGTTVGDASGRNNTGVATDTTWTTGRHGRALSFNGTSSWVTVPHSSALRLTSALTLSAWVRPSTADDQWHTVLMKETDQGGSYGLYSSIGEGPAAWLETADDQGGVAYYEPLPANQWSHLAVTYDGSDATLYVNGAQVEQTPFTGALFDDGGALRIGGNGVWEEYFSGRIDEVRIYNRAQTAAQIQTDMNAPIGAGASGTAQRLSTATTDPARITKLTVDDSRTDKGATATSRLTAWLPAGRDGEAKVDVEIAGKPTKSVKANKVTTDKQLIWSGQATADAGDSRVTLPVPKDRLRAGQEVRWRARLTGPGSTGSWTGWHDLTAGTAGTATTTAADPTPATIKRVLPSGAATSTPTATYQQCHNATTTGNAPYAISPSRFAHCRYSGWVIHVWKSFLGFPDYAGKIEGHQLTYLQGTIDKREFTVRKHIYIDKVEGEPPAGLRFANRIGSNSQGCVAGAAAGMTGSHTVAQWKQAAATQWHITQTFTSGPGTGYHLKSDCTINYSVIPKHPQDGTESSTPVHAEGTFRCDKSPQVKYHNKRGGGCVHLAAVPSFTMTRNDANPRGTTFPNMYDHIKTAFTPGAKTYPEPGGKSYPDLTQAKNIPGGSWRSPLTRHGYEPTRVGLRTTAGRVCEKEVKKEEGKDCDEFPFASTLEGATRANPPHNFSVRRIGETENQDHGLVLKAWYSNNRMLNFDQFWIDIQ
ncbi:Ig-like domain-containing protein [Nonomuraea glycinis]|nr:LamG-like jellyroll fold domain-containing protein [Nonomuraea glycinis]MCA2180991.1 Ig-like domain-containing protein [Nonomuraea glycinis]